MPLSYDILIIGAGPAGASAASLLKQNGFNVLIVEKTKFPRFTLGESFLPQNMVFFEKAGLSKVFDQYKFRPKTGAEFLFADKRKDILFENKSSPGPHATFQVNRGIFDKLIIDEVQSMGVDVLFETEVSSVEFAEDDHPVKITIKDKNESVQKIQGRFIIDASGIAKVLPKMFGHKIHYHNTKRVSYFGHIKTQKECLFNNDRILITVDKGNRKNWFWTIPLQENTYSFGVITEEIFPDLSSQEILSKLIDRNPELKKSLGLFEFSFTPRKLEGYSAQSNELFGEHFVLIGNSGEFLDPIFSSGVTLALKSADLATQVIVKKLRGEAFSFKEDYQEKFEKGLSTFKAFVESWYGQDLQDIIFSEKMNEEISSMIVSILAGYAWDEKNHYTKNTTRRVKALAEICREN